MRMGIDNVIGQRDVWQRLTAMVRDNKLPHAILLCGPRGCGKMAIALAFAQHLAGKNIFTYPDIHFTYPTIKTASMSGDYKPISADFAKEWRTMVEESPYFTMEHWSAAIGAEKKSALITAGESEYLISHLSMRSSSGGYKISLIWLPERMNIECANKMLKLIEEPAEKTLFIMVSDEPERLLETIVSRCQRIDMKCIDDVSMRTALMEQRGLGENDAKRISRMAAGDWIAAMEMLSADSENKTFLDHFQTLMRKAYKTDVRGLKAWADTMQAYDRDKQKRFLSYLLRLVRENFIYNFHKPEMNFMTDDEEDFAKNFSRFINEANVLQIASVAEDAIRDISQNANGKIVFFDVSLKLTTLLRS